MVRLIAEISTEANAAVFLVAPERLRDVEIDSVIHAVDIVPRVLTPRSRDTVLNILNILRKICTLWGIYCLPCNNRRLSCAISCVPGT